MSGVVRGEAPVEYPRHRKTFQPRERGSTA